MKEKKIMLPTMAEAKRFVDEATKCDFDIDVFYNRVTIDAKSILGVLSLDLTRILTVQFNGENQGFEAVSYTHLDVYKRQELHTFDTVARSPQDIDRQTDELKKKGVEVFIANIPCWTWPNGVCLLYTSSIQEGMGIKGKISGILRERYGRLY